MIIAIDFDQTYTADRDTWDEVIDVFRKAGHTVYCVTCRESWDTGSEENGIPRIAEKVDQVFFTGGLAKIDFMEQEGYHVDIWVDDCPATVTGGGRVMYQCREDT